MILYTLWGIITLWSFLGALYSEYFKVVYSYGLIPLVILGFIGLPGLALIAWLIVILAKIIHIVVSKKLPPNFPKSLDDI